MNMNLVADEHPPSIAIESLIARHGPWRILAAVMAALIRHRRKSPDLWGNQVSAHMRKDMGLPPEPKSPRHWDLRL